MRTSKKKKQNFSKRGFLFFSSLIIFIAVAYRIYFVNQQYPSAVEIEIKRGEDLVATDASFKILNYSMENFIDFIEENKGIPTDIGMHNEVSALEDIRVVVVELSLTNITQSEKKYPLYKLEFASDIMRSGLDIDLFYELNKTGDILFSLSAEESVIIKLPYVIHKSAHSNTRWEDMKENDYWLKLQTYPQHIKMLL